MTKPMTDSELAGWRDTLTDLERRLVAAEHDVRSGLGTPDGSGYTMAQRGYFRGRLDALTKARDALLRPIARQQERRLIEGMASRGAETAHTATNGGETDMEPCTDDAAHSGETEAA